MPSNKVLIGYVVITYVIEKGVFKHPLYCPISDIVDTQNKLSCGKWMFGHLLHIFVVGMLFISRIYLGSSSLD